MAIPLLDYSTTSRNHRVAGFEIPGDEQPRIFTTDSGGSNSELDTLIQAAYRQLFNEQQMLVSHRQLRLESQLRAGQLTVREFIAGLATSDSFRRLNYEANNNYRFVQLCIQRILGREVYGDREKIAWSIVLATQGLKGFIQSLVNSAEYLETFGDTVVPYQRRRILPQRQQGDISFAHTARYDADHLATLTHLGNDFSRTGDGWPMPLQWQPPVGLGRIGAALTYGFAGFFSLVALAIILSWFGWISI